MRQQEAVELANPPELNQIVEICKLLHRKNYLAAGDGNVSYRLDERRIYITPTGKNKAFIHENEMAMVGSNGEVIRGSPSSELKMHLAVYQATDEARFVIHAHPPTAIAWTIARPQLAEIPIDAISEAILGVGSIPIVPYARPGTGEMAEAIKPFIRRSRVMILARHGALSWGYSLAEAYNGIERLEHTCLVLKAAVELGGITSLPAEEVLALKEMRKRMGPHSV
jgi:L-fuculose-phosphate aldolase